MYISILILLIPLKLTWYFKIHILLLCCLWFWSYLRWKRFFPSSPQTCLLYVLRMWSCMLIRIRISYCHCRTLSAVECTQQNYDGSSWASNKLTLDNKGSTNKLSLRRMLCCGTIGLFPWKGLRGDLITHVSGLEKVSLYLWEKFKFLKNATVKMKPITSKIPNTCLLNYKCIFQLYILINEIHCFYHSKFKSF